MKHVTIGKKVMCSAKGFKCRNQARLEFARNSENSQVPRRPRISLIIVVVQLVGRFEGVGLSWEKRWYGKKI